MILVALGTQKQSFIRLLRYIEKLIFDEDIKDDIYIQYGETKFDFTKISKNNVHVKNYFNNFDELIKRSDIVICHGGVGIIMSALLNEKKVIAIPRQQKHDEHVNNHQYEIVTELAEKKYILFADNYKGLKENYKQIEFDNELNKYKSNNTNFNKRLNQDIKKLLNK